MLEAVRAAHGDSLLLHFGTKAKPRLAVIDGGPRGVFNDALQPRLLELRKERKLDAGKPLPIDLMMVSHIDDDHVVGIGDLMRELKDTRDSRDPLPWKIARFWHNSFDDLVDDDEVGPAAVASTAGIAAMGTALGGSDGGAILASVANGRELAQLIEAFRLDGNPPFGGLVQMGHAPITLANLTITVVAPDRKRLKKLQTKWNREIKAIIAKEKKTKADRAAIAAFTDTSVHNLSSIVMLVEADGKRMLLTGDGRGDDTLAGLKAAKLLDRKGKLAVDLLKLPHHGSERNVDQSYFDTIRADHYVVSANGRDDNPDIATLKMISKARPDDAFTIHLTYPEAEYVKSEVGKAVSKFFASEKKKGRGYGVEIRKASDLSLKIALSK
jgi:hypothetical protein